MESGRFLPIKIREGGSHFGKDDLFFFLCNCFPEFPIPLKAGFLILGRTYTYIMESRLAVSLSRVADRERKHPGEGASGH